MSMADNKYNHLGSEMEDDAIREALVELGDEEALRLYDEEVEKTRAKAEAEIQEMIKRGEYLPDAEVSI